MIRDESRQQHGGMLWMGDGADGAVAKLTSAVIADENSLNYS
jgi:hypothetical protein